MGRHPGGRGHDDLAWISFNLSSALMIRPELIMIDLASAPRPVMVELALDGEHDPSAWTALIPPLVRIAVHDAGAGTGPIP